MALGHGVFGSEFRIAHSISTNVVLEMTKTQTMSQ